MKKILSAGKVKLFLIAVFLGAIFSWIAQGEALGLESPKIKVAVQSQPFSLRVLDHSGRVLLATEGPIRFSRETNPPNFRFVLWWIWARGLIKPWTSLDCVVSHRAENNRLELGLGSQPGGKALMTMKIFFLDERTLRVESRTLGKDVNRVWVYFRKEKDDRYFGMGERFNSVEHSNQRVRNWSEEGGLGLSYLSEIDPDSPINPFPKGPDTTYYPSPYFLNPAKGFGFLLDDLHYNMFDFGVLNPGKLSIENWNNRFDFMLFYGPSPLEVTEVMTGHTGRITVPAPWVFAPMNAVVKGEDRVLEVAKLLRAEKIPTGAIWSESWWWRTEWEVSRALFPNYEKMIATLHADGFRHLGYYQPYISRGTRAYQEGDAKGYFTKNKKGETYAFSLGFGKKAQVDLTNPAAREWWKDSFFRMSEEMGVDGWMHDFGEHTPPDSVADDGRSGWDLHNEYPLLWAKLGREFWDQARPDHDYCFYIRGGYTGVQKYASVMWTGDQNSNFERLDGLPSNIPGILSVGISGHPIVTTDIAGYNCFVNKSADRELFMRWTELGALLPVMRLHRGNDEVCHMWNFDQDRETLGHYKKYAVLHTSLFPYFYTLSYQAASKGYPLIRHLMLQYPDDPETGKLDYQFLIGDRLLAAPVLKRGAREWELYLPEGEWVHWWTGKTYRGPSWIKVPAGLGEVPLFVRAGKILPLFDSQIDTLVKENRDDLNGWDDANKSIKVLFFGDGEDDYTIWDGTRFHCESKTRKCEMTNSPVKRTLSVEFKN